MTEEIETCGMSSCVAEAEKGGLCAYHFEMVNVESLSSARVLWRILKVLEEIRDQGAK